MKIQSSYTDFFVSVRALKSLERNKEVAWIITNRSKKFFGITAYYYDQPAN